MSRIGKKIILIPQKTEVKITPDGVVTVKGPHGELSRKFRSEITVAVEDGKISLNPTRNSQDTKALWGTYASHIENMVAGVNKPFEKKLTIEGIGYRSEVQAGKMVLSLGFSHPVNVPIPSDLKVTAEKNVIVVTGINKESVGEFAAKVRSLKKPEPYKGKGIRYQGEVVKMKQGKKSV